MSINLGQSNVDNLYAEMARLRGQTTAQPMSYRTVFNDISDEWSACSEDERRYIEQDTEYVNANFTYQQQFNAFLLDLVGVQFINSQYGKSAEAVLVALRNSKAKYKKETVDNIASVKAENAELQRQLEELKKIVRGRQNANG
jgi:hypothetical protein